MIMAQNNSSDGDEDDRRAIMCIFSGLFNF